jgi:gas vesicle protein
MNTRQTSARQGIPALWLGMIIGALTAGVIVLLYAPMSGRETISTIKNRATQAKDAIIWHAREEAQAVDKRTTKKK